MTRRYQEPEGTADPNHQERQDKRTSDKSLEGESYPSSEKAGVCDSCGAILTRGESCSRCKPQRSERESRSNTRPVPSSVAAREHRKRIGHIVVAVVGAGSEIIATTKARAALKSGGAESGQELGAFNGFDLLAEVDDVPEPIDNRWGELPDTATVQSERGRSFLEEVKAQIASSDGGGKFQNVLYADSGEVISDPSAVDELIANGEQTDIVHGSGAHMLVPAISYRRNIGPDTPIRQLTCRNCGSITDHAYDGVIELRDDTASRTVKDLVKPRHIWVCLDCHRGRYASEPDRVSPTDDSDTSIEAECIPEEQQDGDWVEDSPDDLAALEHRENLEALEESGDIPQ